MKRWQVELDGVACPVYADTLEAARKAAQAAYVRVFPERDPGQSRVKVGEGTDVASPAGEARQIVSEVYEGLRLLPGMELPAEKIRSAVLLLETVAARHGLAPSGVSDGGAGDTELNEALAPVLTSRTVPTLLKERVKGLVEWVGVNTAEPERRRIELETFRALWEAGLIDPRLGETASCALHKASAYLVKRLVAATSLRLERFRGASNVEEFRGALRGQPKDAVVMLWGFVPAREGPEEVTLLRPLAFVNDRVLQPALLLRGVGSQDDEVVAFDRALVDALNRLRLWQDGLGRLAEPHWDETQLKLIARTEQRIDDVRQKMAQAAQDKQLVLPTDTSRRDLMRFVIDQVHRIADALAYLPDRTLRDAFVELVFKDVVFRGVGAYLSKHHGIGIDTGVVEGADTQELAGRYKTETGGPKPRAKTTRINSVVLPCYTQGSATIRPASVRIGDY